MNLVSLKNALDKAVKKIQILLNLNTWCIFNILYDKNEKFT